MRKSYVFWNAVQAAHYKQYREGHAIMLGDEVMSAGQGDGAKVAELAERFQDLNLVSLEPDVKAVFPDSAAVNAALRMLIDTAGRAKELAKAS